MRRSREASTGTTRFRPSPASSKSACGRRRSMHWFGAFSSSAMVRAPPPGRRLTLIARKASTLTFSYWMSPAGTWWPPASPQTPGAGSLMHRTRRRKTPLLHRRVPARDPARRPGRWLRHPQASARSRNGGAADRLDLPLGEAVLHAFRTASVGRAVPLRSLTRSHTNGKRLRDSPHRLRRG
jgi:hypothetical protein